MIYVASSWRNERYPLVIETLRHAGLDPYDFKNSESAFSWADIDPEWKSWDALAFLSALDTQRAIKGFNSDLEAIEHATACVLVLPAGNSSHIEAGYALGCGTPTAILLPETGPIVPDLLYKLASRVTPYIDEVVDWAKKVRKESIPLTL